MSKIQDRLKKETGETSPFSKKGMAWLRKEANKLKYFLFRKQDKVTYAAIFKKHITTKTMTYFSIIHNVEKKRFTMVLRVGGKRDEIRLSKKEIKHISGWLNSRLGKC